MVAKKKPVSKSASSAGNRSKTPGPISDERLEKAQEVLGYEFKKPELLSQALCHASTRNEGLESNERLEFLGDAVLGMLVSWFLYEGLPAADEGALSSRRARMTQGDHLAKVGQRLGLGNLLRTGKNQDLAPTPAMEGDLVEACLGAIFLDGGLPASQKFVLDHIITTEKAKEDAPSYTDPKSQLQHFTLARHLGLPEYRQVDVSGPAHAQEFKMEVAIAGKVLGTGNGTSKKAAQQKAASAAIEVLRKAEASSKPTSGDDAEDGGTRENGEGGSEEAE